MHTTKFSTGYMDNAVFDLEKVVANAVDELLPHTKEFDTLVGTGFSGGMVIPMIALALKKKFVLIRKETDDSHHGSGRLLGELGERWIFVGDFVSSGRTKRRVIEKVIEAAVDKKQHTMWAGGYYYAGMAVWEPTDEYNREAYAAQTKAEEDRVARRDADESDWFVPRTRSAKSYRRMVELPPAPVEDEPLADWEKELLYGIGDGMTVGAPISLKKQPKLRKPVFDMYEMKTVMPDFTAVNDLYRQAVMNQRDAYAALGQAFRETRPVRIRFDAGDINENPAWAKPTKTARERFQEILESKKKVEPGFAKFTKKDFRLEG